MTFEWGAAAKIGGWLFKLVKGPLESARRKRMHSQQALDGRDFVNEGSLVHLVSAQLKGMAKNVPGADHDAVAFRAWLSDATNVELFMQVLLAHSAGRPETSQNVERALLADYTRANKLGRALPGNSVAKAVSYVYGQLTATPAGKESLVRAISQHLTISSGAPAATYLRLIAARELSQALLVAGRTKWKMPAFVAPLALETHESVGSDDAVPLQMEDLLAYLDEGGSAVLHGEGGIGKTTLLLEICSEILSNRARVPLYIDAAAWGRSNKSLFEYVENLPGARVHGIDARSLAKLAEEGRLTVLLNGWNEMSQDSKLSCGEDLDHARAAAERLALVVTSRASSDVPALGAEKKVVQVRGLSFKAQSEVIHAELGAGLAPPIIRALATDSRLRRAARSPLILRGIISSAQRSISAWTIYDLIGAAVAAFEQEPQHRLALADSPIESNHGAYLEELACRLVDRRETILARDEALKAISAAHESLKREGLVGSIRSQAEILDLLVRHHLLHEQSEGIRFAHQRFQEFYAATRIIRSCATESRAFVREICNRVSWEEALDLAATKLASGPLPTRIFLVDVARTVDIGLACSLLEACGVQKSAAPQLVDQIVASVLELATSDVEEVRCLGEAWQVACGLDAFASEIWRRLEAAKDLGQIRQYRPRVDGINIGQLGDQVESRILAWPAGVRAVFVTLLGETEENYEFLSKLAASDPDDSVRIAAIGALFWSFPASNAAIEAWLQAAPAVQLDHGLLGYIRYAVQEGRASDAVYTKLREIDLSMIPDGRQIGLAIAFPKEVGARAIDRVIDALRSSAPNAGGDESLAAIAREYAPERLDSLLAEMAIRESIPAWAADRLRESSTATKAAYFEAAWSALQSGEAERVGVIAGEIADQDQVKRCVAFLLSCARSGQSGLTVVEDRRRRAVKSLLRHANGELLFNAVTDAAPATSYKEAACLMELVWQRVPQEQEDREEASAPKVWLPNPTHVEKLSFAFGAKREVAEVPQDEVFAYLACFAVAADKEKYLPMLLEACGRHLDAWDTYREKSRAPTRTGRQSHLRSPMHGRMLSAALVRCGFSAIPGLLDLLGRDSGMEFIPRAALAVVLTPWSSVDGYVYSSCATDIANGLTRREGGLATRQPDTTAQARTDAVAAALGSKLSLIVTQMTQARDTNQEFDSRLAAHRIGRLAEVVARIPSPEILGSLQVALSSSLMDVYHVVSVLRGLAYQGAQIYEPGAVEGIERLHAREIATEWHDASTKSTLASLSQLLACAVDRTVVASRSHYVAAWKRFAYLGEIIRDLGTQRSEVGWHLLVEIAESHPDDRTREEVAYSLTRALTKQRVPDLIVAIRDLQFLQWFRSSWDVERSAPSIAQLVSESGYVDEFAGACRRACTSRADLLGGLVCARIPSARAQGAQLLLDALDAGRASDIGSGAYRMLKACFTLTTQLSDTYFELAPLANNALRKELYLRSKGNCMVAATSRQLLADVEAQRYEDGRPPDETRHPDLSESAPWTDIFVSRHPQPVASADHSG